MSLLTRFRVWRNRNHPACVAGRLVEAQIGPDEMAKLNAYIDGERKNFLVREFDHSDPYDWAGALMDTYEAMPA